MANTFKDNLPVVKLDGEVIDYAQLEMRPNQIGVFQSPVRDGRWIKLTLRNGSIIHDDGKRVQIYLYQQHDGSDRMNPRFEAFERQNPQFKDLKGYARNAEFIAFIGRMKSEYAKARGLNDSIPGGCHIENHVDFTWFIECYG